MEILSQQLSSVQTLTLGYQIRPAPWMANGRNEAARHRAFVRLSIGRQKK